MQGSTGKLLTHNTVYKYSIMSSETYLRLPTPTYAYLRLPTPTYAYLRLPIPTNTYQYLPMSAHAYLCLPMPTYVCPCLMVLGVGANEIGLMSRNT